MSSLTRKAIMKLKMSDIAKKAGVSKAAVSFALLFVYRFLFAKV